MLTLLASLFLAAPADTLRPVTVIVVRHAENTQVDAVLSNSFGFGGANASLVFRRLA